MTNNNSIRVLYIANKWLYVSFVEHMLSRQMNAITGRSPYDVYGAVGGREGLARIDKDKPDILLLDAVLPDMDGLEVYEYIRANPTTADLPVAIAVQQKGWNCKIYRADGGGLTANLPKPFGPISLRSVIDRLLGERMSKL